MGKLLHSIQSETSTACSVMESGAAAAEQQSVQSQQAVVNMHELLELAKRMETAISDSAIVANVELANIDELELKLEVYRVFFGISGLQAEDMHDEQHCRLGQWYYTGDGRQLFKQMSNYTELEAPHKAVHDHAIAAIRLHRQSRLEEALQQLNAMEQANLAVMRGMAQLVSKALAR